MWNLFLQFCSEWLSRPSGVTTIGIVAGLVLYLVGIIWRVRRDRQIGLLVVAICLVAGVVAYFLG